MNQKMFQAWALGFLILFSISTSAQSEDVKSWVKDDQSPAHAYGPFSMFMGTTGVTLHQFFRGDRLRDQARKAVQKGDRKLAESLQKKAERSEGVGGVGMFLVLPTAIIAINKEMDVQAKRSQLSDEREARQREKAMTTQPVGGANSQSADVHAVSAIAD